MNVNTLTLIGLSIGALIATNYGLYHLYKYVDEIETENMQIHSDFTDLKIEHSYLKKSYITLYDNMTDEEKEQYKLNFPFRIPPFIKL